MQRVGDAVLGRVGHDHDVHRLERHRHLGRWHVAGHHETIGEAGAGGVGAHPGEHRVVLGQARPARHQQRRRVAASERLQGLEDQREALGALDEAEDAHHGSPAQPVARAERVHGRGLDRHAARDRRRDDDAAVGRHAAREQPVTMQARVHDHRLRAAERLDIVPGGGADGVGEGAAQAARVARRAVRTHGVRGHDQRRTDRGPQHSPRQRVGQRVHPEERVGVLHVGDVGSAQAARIGGQRERIQTVRPEDDGLELDVVAQRDAQRGAVIGDAAALAHRRVHGDTMSHRLSWGAPTWPPTPPNARTRPGRAVARLGLDTRCLTGSAPCARARRGPARRGRRPAAAAPTPRGPRRPWRAPCAR